MLAASNGNLPISKVAAFASLSIRQFERKAKVSLGVSPKLYSRVLRFTNAWLYREAHPDISWYKITHEFGYADQMHLVDDFKIFCGTTPTGISDQVAAKMLTGIEGRLKVQVC
ncbi:helix-turn-helix domain-containing protein [Niabella hibiscisoli]|uniref:helix-turn-helix domain-containing protein n=1 Tax=Niabella hibiscisoli TaxID=1825928 RepID=UPI00374DAE07